jgi:hypothetical protein
MHPRLCVVFLLGLALTAKGAPPDDDIARALAAIKAVKKEGRGNDDAGPAWKTLVGRGASALLPTLTAFDDSNPTATNWLRTAVDAIAEGEAAAGRKLPAEQLEAFASNEQYAPSARRRAYELLIAQDPEAKTRLLPGFLNDKSAELRRDAIAAELDRLERADPPTIKTDLAGLFAQTRDKDQVELLARKVAAKGGKVSITEHFGFINHASLIGPFDAPGGKGYELSYPPDNAKEAAGRFPGKGGMELTWKPSSTADNYGAFDLNTLLGKHKNAVAYALAVVISEKEIPCQIRVTSITSVKIFLNQKEIFGRDEYHHGAPFDAHIGKGTLHKGENVIVLKICQDDEKESWAQAWQFQMRLCDETGGALPLEQKIATNGNTKTIKLGFNPNPVVVKEKK